MRISKSILWLEEYIEAVKPLLPEIKKLKRISTKVPSRNLNTNQSCHGIITKYYNGKDHRITLYTKYLFMELRKGEVHMEIKKYSMIDNLCFMAHELAHLRYWDHTPEHKKLESAIISLFMDILKKNGYKCEEDEASYFEPCRVNNGY